MQRSRGSWHVRGFTGGQPLRSLMPASEEVKRSWIYRHIRNGSGFSEIAHSLYKMSLNTSWPLFYAFRQHLNFGIFRERARNQKFPVTFWAVLLAINMIFNMSQILCASVISSVRQKRQQLVCWDGLSYTEVTNMSPSLCGSVIKPNFFPWATFLILEHLIASLFHLVTQRSQISSSCPKLSLGFQSHPFDGGDTRPVNCLDLGVTPIIPAHSPCESHSPREAGKCKGARALVK